MGVEYVILVNKNDMPLGTMEKMEAHEKGVLHRAFSVFIFNSQGELMLQQRALHKYHSPGLWTNTVCSHPRVGEEVLEAAHRRMEEEMGFNCEIKELFSFVYKSDVGQGLREHEFDHVLIGVSDKQPNLNPDEVADWKYADFDFLLKDIVENPEVYTVWFKIALAEMRKHRMLLPLKK
jgi:isopentenyl-diphosphate delta-isomerase